ncbi:hypothetical protein SCP_1003820 [Sparassis crispa]|uniref:VHS domain-containing protein n=1 Tax=Sparassis crispa TaxID=139825 RepID=A0A401GY31_9APHY|nr:hypothetical protein SCP_1003820 [Sparassis crispa]GBE87135.1 hypothetical protein SCP_1003820 [Sparassis crispa]
MKRLFGRDKAKGKPVPGSKDLAAEIAPGAQESYAYVSHPPHNAGRGQSSPLSVDEHWHMVDNDSHTYTVRSAMSGAGYSPSLASTPLLSVPRAVSPVASNPVSPQPMRSPNPRDRDRDPNALKKKGVNGPNAFGAIGILKALDPHPEPPLMPELSEDSLTEASFREEKKERKSFWDRSGLREKEKERGKDRERREEEAHDVLTRMIGYLTASASEDWSLVLEVCERASANEVSAKEAAKALRREFKYAEPAAQLSAARLWAIMLRNSSEIFIWQCTSRKFLDTLEDVITSSRTSPVVRERLLEVLAAAAYASKDSGFRHLWKKVKPADKPDEGIPFDASDAMFQPPPRHHYASHPDQPPQVPPRPPSSGIPHKKISRHHVIPPEEDMRRLFQECKVGRGNAALLSESLTYAKPEDLKSKDIIREFYARCRASQELISAQIPWAFAGAERSRQATGRAEVQHRDLRPSIDSDHPTEESVELTPEEHLLAALLAANEDLMEALRVYDDLERVGLEREIEREAEDRSRKETRIDRSQLRYNEAEDSLYLEPGYPYHGGASSSRSPSPSLSASPSPAPSFVITPMHVSHNQNHPLPALPHHGGSTGGHHQQTAVPAQGSIVSLAPPPPAPMGPRSFTHGSQRSRTPSPEQPAYVARSSLEVRQNGTAHDLNRFLVPDVDPDDERTPKRPSAKALGKRRIIESVEADHHADSDEFYYEHNEDTMRSSEDPLESESDEGHHHPWHQPVNYVYDAAAELTQQRIREGLAAVALVSGVH